MRQYEIIVIFVKVKVKFEESRMNLDDLVIRFGGNIEIEENLE